MVSLVGNFRWVINLLPTVLQKNLLPTVAMVSLVGNFRWVINLFLPILEISRILGLIVPIRNPNTPKAAFVLDFCSAAFAGHIETKRCVRVRVRVCVCVCVCVCV